MYITLTISMKIKLCSSLFFTYCSNLREKVKFATHSHARALEKSRVEHRAIDN